jgi:hypothetical protein
MIHVTLNTGHAVQHAWDDISPDALAALRPVLGGGDIPGYPGYQVIVSREPGAAIFTVTGPPPTPGDPRNPLVTCGVAWHGTHARTTWDSLVSNYDRLRMLGLGDPPPQMPLALPWCGIIVWPGIAFDKKALAWLGDYERCMATALVMGYNTN